MYDSKNKIQVYSNLGRFLKEYYFGKEKAGCEVFPTVDISLIKQFCKKEGINYDIFIQLIQRKSLWEIHWEISELEMLGFIGIQLFAASKMENSDGLSSGNYRDRICSKEILNIDVNDWQTWARTCQDNLWSKYYSWCSIHGFILENKCTRFEGKDRYVQYPKSHSSLTLNREDLKRIANLFVQKRISPTEDLSDKEFWRIIGRYHYENYYSNRAKRILDENRDLANKQIFQYYLMWDGEYVDPLSNKIRTQETKYQLFLYLNKNNWSVDVYNTESCSIEKNIQLEKLYELDLRRFHTQKHTDYILFRVCQEYDNYWEECRYLTDKSNEGLALFDRRNFYNQYRSKDVVSVFKNYTLVKINYNSYPRFYSEDRPYSLTGGIKILPNTYILGAPPLLTFFQETPFWIDGIKQKNQRGIIILHLSEGKHVISIQGYKPIILQIKSVSPTVHSWGDNRKWLIKRSSRISLWNSDSDNGDVIGLDFEHLSNNNKIEDKSVLTRWCRNLVFKKSSDFLKL